ncbi:hypothetical protein FOZ62_007236 [Perkinsus olseni]|uniref:Uncharacterized protein n=1 Tax=Perkinsus olseni TaxID=32597 RepID=A0A7J6REJ3_PEROL|nr:hypothetical protein FOZ62_007236 [Perkinsus olseni]
MIDKDGVLKAVHDIDAPLSTFVRLTEAARREREAKIAAGDDSAKLMVIQPVVSHYSGGKGGGRRVDYSRSGKGGYQSYQQHSGPYHARYNPASGRGPVGGQYQRGYQSGGKGYANGGPQQQQYYAYKRPYDTGAYDPSKRQKGGRGGRVALMAAVTERHAIAEVDDGQLVMVQRPPAPPPPRGEVSPTESEREENALPNHEEELLDLRKDIMVSIEKLYESNDVMAEEIRSASGDDLTEARELYSYIEENMDVLERKFRKLRAINRKLGLPEEDGCCGQPKMKLPLGPREHKEEEKGEQEGIYL